MAVAHISCRVMTTVDWQSAAGCGWADEVAVFCLFLPDFPVDVARLYAILHPSEQQRADRYQQSADRQRYIAGRGLLRVLTGLYLNRVPAAVNIGIGPRQKPELADCADWQVNVSHAGSWVLIAVGRVAVGVDVEELNPDFPISQLLPVAFSPAEQQVITGSTNPITQFYRFWTRKEAILKATGFGVGADLPTVPCAEGYHEIFSGHIGAPEAGCWSVVGTSLPDGSPAAVAVAMAATKPHWYRIDTPFVQIYFPVT